MPTDLDDIEHPRAIKSFVLRQGRMTPAQKAAFAKLWSIYGLEYQAEPIDLAQLFGNSNPVYMEIGFGNGVALAAMALRHPDRNYLGIEVHSPGVGNLMNQLEENNSHNVRLMKHDAIEVIDNMLQDNVLSGSYLFFPDPWHKRKHHKRRIVKQSFLEKLHRITKADGFFHAATDWQHYAQHIMKELTVSPLFENTAGEGQYTPRPEDRPLTKFEQRGHRLGHGVWDLIFKRR